LDALAGAEVRYVGTGTERAPAMDAAADEVTRSGGRPYVIPLGASTPLGAAGFVTAMDELLTQIEPPDVIVHATSSGGTQAGLVAGGLLAGIGTRVLGISSDDSAASLERRVGKLIDGVASLFGRAALRPEGLRIEVDDSFVGDGYGIPTDASNEAIRLLARTEGLFLDPTYTAKAMAGLIAKIRAGTFTSDQTILFWHTGGQVGLFA
jgi:1-aminocyclopropane-1-carboxylate deaminase/D-cysteine desulfhydrase-like pyridoxal-dependent ACC family enzyme